jgi:hypothetical protein
MGHRKNRIKVVVELDDHAGANLCCRNHRCPTCYFSILWRIYWAWTCACIVVP